MGSTYLQYLSKCTYFQLYMTCTTLCIYKHMQYYKDYTLAQNTNKIELQCAFIKFMTYSQHYLQYSLLKLMIHYTTQLKKHNKDEEKSPEQPADLLHRLNRWLNN